MMYSKQIIFCNACGIKMETSLPNVCGREFRTCSQTCYKEMQWRNTLSIMGQEYTPQKDKDNE